VASAARGLLGEYEELIARDGNKVLPMDGTIRSPLTAQVLSYVKVGAVPQQGIRSVWQELFSIVAATCVSGHPVLEASGAAVQLQCSYLEGHPPSQLHFCTMTSHRPVLLPFHLLTFRLAP